MKFEGCDPIEQRLLKIEIEKGNEIWDMHNAAEFEGYSYNVCKRIFTLNWKFYYEFGKNIHECRIILKNVEALEITKRDKAYPRTEDDCLEGFIINENVITFKFQDESTIIVVCDCFIFENYGRQGDLISDLDRVARKRIKRFNKPD